MTQTPASLPPGWITTSRPNVHQWATDLFPDDPDAARTVTANIGYGGEDEALRRRARALLCRRIIHGH